MWTPTFIRRFIHSLPLNKIFTTRDVLICGSRSAVDQALWRLVNKGVIIRLARGVFIKEGSNIPSPFEVAQAKCRSFFKPIAEHGSTIAARLKFIDQTPNRIIFTTTGRSSKFWFGNIRIHIKGISARKMELNKSNVGCAVAALLYMGKDLFNLKNFYKLHEMFIRRDQSLKFKLSRPLMPDWLGRHYITRSYIPIAIE